MNSYNVDRDEALERGNEAFNASWLKYFRSIKRFIAMIFTRCLTLHRRYFLTEIHRVTLYRCYF
jgi:hypothetical protein